MAASSTCSTGRTAKGVGGSALVDDLSDTTRAEVDGGAAVYDGASGGLTIDASEDILRVSISQSGALTTGSGGTLAFAGSLLGWVQTSKTIAGLIDTAGAGVSLSGGGNLAISATTGGTNVGIAGSVVVGQGSATGIGVSAVLNDLTRTTAAVVGVDPTSGNPQAAPLAASSLAVGALTLDAATTGVVVGVAVAGTGSTSSSDSSDPNSPSNSDGTVDLPGSEDEQDPDDPLDGVSLPSLFEESESASNESPSAESGVAVAGSALVTLNTDKTFAYVSDSGTIDATGAVSLDANNSQLDIQISGAVAIATSGKGGNTGSKAIAGAFGVNVDAADTEAFIRDTTVSATDQPAGAPDGISLTATRDGSDVSLTASLAGNTTTDGTSFAGSASVNYITDTNIAVLDGAQVTEAAGGAGTTPGSITLSAQDDLKLYAIGGGASFATGAGSKGVGASLGYNQLTAQTHAGVLGTDQRAVVADTDGGLSVTAENAEVITAVGVSAGVATNGTGAAFTIGINILSSSPSIFDPGTANAILAELSNAAVTVGGPATLNAQDNSVIQSLAGALGVGLEGNAFGIGLSWNQVVLQVGAMLQDATLTTTGADNGVTLSAQSTQTSGLIDGKISSAAVSGAVGNSTAIGAAVSVDGIIDTLTAEVDAASAIAATGAVSVTATDSSTINTLVGGAGISTDSVGVGAAVGGNFIDNTIEATIDGSVTADIGSVDATAQEAAEIQAITVGLAGGDEVAVAGSVSVDVVTDTVKATVGSVADVQAAGAVNVDATNGATVGAVAGQIAISGEAGIGAAITAVVITNDTEASVSGDSIVHGTGGVGIEALDDENLADFAIGGSVGGEVGIAGSATSTTIDDTTKAFVSAADTSALAGAGVTAGVIGSASTSGDVDIEATDDLELLGTAGSLSFGGEVGVGVGIDAGVVLLDTEATIGAGARVAADGSVSVLADGSEDITSVSASGSGGGEVAVGANAGVTVLNLTTKAEVDSDAVVTARDNVVVSAQDGTTTTQVAGDINAAGEVAVGVAANIGVITKNTDATVDAGASITALALGGQSTVNTGTFGTPGAGDGAQAASDNVTFASSAVDFATGVITADSHGLSTGDKVSYSGQHGPLGGLQDGAVYYVIKLDDNTFELASSYANAVAKIAITLSPGLAASGSENSVSRLNSVGLPDISSGSFSGSQITGDGEGSPLTAVRSGVIVVAVSTNTLQNAGAAAGGAGIVAVEVSGAVAVDTINTAAAIAGGATVNGSDAGAASGQGVYVDAGRTYSDLTLGLSAAISGVFAGAPAIAVPVLKGTTSAEIGDGTSDGATVEANGDIEVNATASEDFVVVAVGIAGSGIAAAAGSALGCRPGYDDGSGDRGRRHRDPCRRQRAGGRHGCHDRLRDRGRGRHRDRRRCRGRRGQRLAAHQDRRGDHRRGDRGRRRAGPEHAGQRRRRRRGQRRGRACTDRGRGRAGGLQRDAHRHRGERRGWPVRGGGRRGRRGGARRQRVRRHQGRRARRPEHAGPGQRQPVGRGRRARHRVRAGHRRRARHRRGGRRCRRGRGRAQHQHAGRDQRQQRERGAGGGGQRAHLPHHRQRCGRGRRGCAGPGRRHRGRVDRRRVRRHLHQPVERQVRVRAELQ